MSRVTQQVHGRTSTESCPSGYELSVTLVSSGSASGPPFSHPHNNLSQPTAGSPCQREESTLLGALAWQGPRDGSPTPTAWAEEPPARPRQPTEPGEIRKGIHCKHLLHSNRIKQPREPDVRGVPAVSQALW